MCVAQVPFTKAVPIFSPTSDTDKCLLLHSIKFLYTLRSIRWKWYLSLVLNYTAPTVWARLSLFNRTHFPSCSKCCFLRPHAIIHSLAGFCIVRLAKDGRARPIAFCCQERLLHRVYDAPEGGGPMGGSCVGCIPAHHCLSKKLNSFSQFPHLKNEDNPPWEDHHEDQWEKHMQALNTTPSTQSMLAIDKLLLQWQKNFPTTSRVKQLSGLVAGSEFPITTNAQAVTTGGRKDFGTGQGWGGGAELYNLWSVFQL